MRSMFENTQQPSLKAQKEDLNNQILSQVLQDIFSIQDSLKD